MWEVYDALLESLPRKGSIGSCCISRWWTLCEIEGGGSGLAMTVPWEQRPAMYPDGLLDLRIKVAGIAVKSWNLKEAGAAMAACNAYYNSPARMKAFRCEAAFEDYCTAGLDMAGKTVGIVGHLSFPPGVFAGAEEVYILEREPQSGDYPDSACDFLLPRCDLVLISGSTLVNKTLPHLLSLTENAYTILTGPTTPLCPELLFCGIDRLAGMVVTDRRGLRVHVTGDIAGSPYQFGKSFMLTKDK